MKDIPLLIAQILMESVVMPVVAWSPFVPKGLAIRRTTNMTMEPALQQKADDAFMQEAILDAARAASHGEVPVGAVLVHDHVIIARGGNAREREQDPTAHAELTVIREAAHTLHSWRLTGTTLYVTLEPCLMCAGAMLLARIPRLVFGARDPKAGACGSCFSVHENAQLNHRIAVTQGIREHECRDMLQQFFQQVRQNRLAAIH